MMRSLCQTKINIMKKLRTVHLDIHLNAGKEKTWDLLFNRFGETYLFNPLLEGSHFTKGNSGEVGCERQCDLDSKNSIQERIVAVRNNDSFDIDIIQGGLPFMDKMKGTFSVAAINAHQSVVTAVIQYNTSPAFMGGLLKSMLAKNFFKVMVGLKYYLETGEVVTKINIGDIIKTYKLLSPTDSFSIENMAA